MTNKLSETFFLSQDHDGHWYVVPTRLKKMWEIWLNLSGDNEEAWEAPDGVIRVGGSYELVKFTGFTID